MATTDFSGKREERKAGAEPEPGWPESLVAAHHGCSDVVFLSFLLSSRI
jgi:hypothetical protein